MFYAAVAEYGRRGLDKSSMAQLDAIMKAGPPREGLVPQSGDPEHSGRWIKPKDGADGGGKPTGGDKPSGLDIDPGQMERIRNVFGRFRPDEAAYIIDSPPEELDQRLQRILPRDPDSRTYIRQIVGTGRADRTAAQLAEDSK